MNHLYLVMFKSLLNIESKKLCVTLLCVGNGFLSSSLGHQSYVNLFENNFVWPGCGGMGCQGYS